MTEQDDTLAADVQNSENSEKNDHTTASALGADADTTWVPSDPATVDQYAWSEGDELDDDQRHPWARALAIAAGVLALGTVTAVVVAANGQHGNDLHGSALPVTVRAVAPSAPVVPDIHHVGPAPAAATVLAVPVDKDARFLALIAPQHLAPKYMDDITGSAQDLCRKIAVGDTTRTGWIANLLKGTDLTLDQVTFYVDTAIEVYCPQYTY